MKLIFSMLIAVIGLAGCATGKSIQADCASSSSTTRQEIACLSKNLRNDGRYAANPYTDVYLLKAQQLDQKIDRGQVSDADARIELKVLLAELNAKQDERVRAIVFSDDGMPTKKTKMNCTTTATNQIDCKEK